MDIIKRDGCKNIFLCDCCDNEINELYKKDRQRAEQYSRWLDKRLGFLDTRALLDLLNDMPNTFEKARGVSEGIYVIKNPEFKGNPRILFLANFEDGEYTYVLLTAFHELNSGDYPRYINLAKLRIKALKQL